MKFDAKKVAAMKSDIRKLESQLQAAERAATAAHKAYENGRRGSKREVLWRTYSKLDCAAWTLRDRIGDREMQMVNYLMQFATSDVRAWVKASLY